MYIFGVFLVRIFSHSNCSLSLCIQSECGKIRTRKSTNTDTFHVVIVLRMFLRLRHLKKINHRSSRPEVFCKKCVLRNFVKFTGNSEVNSEVFPREFCEMFKSTFFIEHLMVAASEFMEASYLSIKCLKNVSAPNRLYLTVYRYRIKINTLLPIIDQNVR